MKQLYETILSLVSKHTGIQTRDITGSCKDETLADARFLLVHFLARYFTNKEIQSLTGICRSSVSRLRMERRSRSFKPSVQLNMRLIEQDLSDCDEIKGLKRY